MWHHKSVCKIALRACDFSVTHNYFYVSHGMNIVYLYAMTTVTWRLDSGPLFPNHNLDDETKLYMKLI